MLDNHRKITLGQISKPKDKFSKDKCSLSVSHVWILLAGRGEPGPQTGGLVPASCRSMGVESPLEERALRAAGWVASI